MTKQAKTGSKTSTRKKASTTAKKPAKKTVATVKAKSVSKADVTAAVMKELLDYFGKDKGGDLEVVLSRTSDTGALLLIDTRSKPDIEEALAKVRAFYKKHGYSLKATTDKESDSAALDITGITDKKPAKKVTAKKVTAKEVTTKKGRPPKEPIVISHNKKKYEFDARITLGEIKREKVPDIVKNKVAKARGYSKSPTGGGISVKSKLAKEPKTKPGRPSKEASLLEIKVDGKTYGYYPNVKLGEIQKLKIPENAKIAIAKKRGYTRGIGKKVTAKKTTGQKGRPLKYATIDGVSYPTSITIRQLRMMKAPVSIKKKIAKARGYTRYAFPEPKKAKKAKKVTPIKRVQKAVSVTVSGKNYSTSVGSDLGDIQKMSIPKAAKTALAKKRGYKRIPWETEKKASPKKASPKKVVKEVTTKKAGKEVSVTVNKKNYSAPKNITLGQIKKLSIPKAAKKALAKKRGYKRTGL